MQVVRSRGHRPSSGPARRPALRVLEAPWRRADELTFFGSSKIAPAWRGKKKKSEQTPQLPLPSSGETRGQCLPPQCTARAHRSLNVLCRIARKSAVRGGRPRMRSRTDQRPVGNSSKNSKTHHFPPVPRDQTSGRCLMMTLCRPDPLKRSEHSDWSTNNPDETAVPMVVGGVAWIR